MMDLDGWRDLGGSPRLGTPKLPFVSPEEDGRTKITGKFTSWSSSEDESDWRRWDGSLLFELLLDLKLSSLGLDDDRGGDGDGDAVGGGDNSFAGGFKFSRGRGRVGFKLILCRIDSWMDGEREIGFESSFGEEDC